MSTVGLGPSRAAGKHHAMASGGLHPMSRSCCRSRPRCESASTWRWNCPVRSRRSSISLSLASLRPKSRHVLPLASSSHLSRFRSGPLIRPPPSENFEKMAVVSLANVSATDTIGAALLEMQSTSFVVGADSSCSSRYVRSCLRR